MPRAPSIDLPPLRREIPERMASIALALALVLAAGLMGAHSVWAEPRRERIIVKFESEGSHALDACAETLFREAVSYTHLTLPTKA